MDIRRLDQLDFADKRVTVVGLGVEGVDLVRYLSRQGASITVSDSKSREQLTEALAEIAQFTVRLSLGSNQSDDISGADLVFVSQGVPLNVPALALAGEKGVPILSMTGLFLEMCPGPVAGITGSSGKTTTTALVREMFEADERPVFVGGNIGIGLLDHLADVRTYTWAVLEVSHTQLQLVDSSPHVAAILNVAPNHLDRFSWDEYRQLKANILRFQTAEDVAILNFDDPETRALGPEVRGRLLWFTLEPELRGDGVFCCNGAAVLRMGGRTEELFDLESIRLRGRHNVANALAAAAIATACGVSAEAIACAVAAFQGVQHRLEFVTEAKGVHYYNDSIATTPERTLAGLRSFSEPLVLLLGGRDKNLPLDELAGEALRRCRAVVVFGESAGKLEEALGSAGPQRSATIERVGTLAEAVAAARQAAEAGDVILLSPACTSYDAYENFEQRGDHFRALVRAVVQEAAPSLR